MFEILQNYFSYKHVIKAIIYYYKMFFYNAILGKRSVYPYQRMLSAIF